MVSKQTKGVNVTVVTLYEGFFQRGNSMQFAFSYEITIENQSDSTIQIHSRYWEIYDSLNTKEIVEGLGVVGEQPFILPQEKYTYSSGCVLTSTSGAMQGYYNVIRTDNQQMISIEIPFFKLIAPFILN
ncbi:Co2+/Mg2+ efflux protein ApaG [Myroides fluvii]|uniref:Co2+/Mg2+ efflux protein ApaG n=1 Tax=Myroides fluvii TaxID=2572594 RepID=UPI00131E8320|nr:Co2+/Mg2+ efflux protein ApaG [Myroides fluvii]